MDATDLTALAAAQIAARVHDGRTSAVAVAGAHLARIAERDEHLGAFQEHDPERVLAEAGAVDRRADRFALPLAGVPVAIKDSVDVAGYPTRHGSAATSTAPARRDDELVKRLRAAGAVVVGKTRMPELAIWGFTHSALGTTRNPLDPSLRSRRLQRRQRRGGRGGDGRARAGHRRRRLDPHPGGVLRAGRGQARPRRRPAAGRRGRALVRAVGGGSARAHRRGRRADAGCAAGRPSRLDAPGRCTWRCRCSAPLPFTRLHADHRAAAVGAAARLRAAPGGAAVTLADPPYPRTLAWRGRAAGTRAWPGDAAELELDLAAVERRTAAVVRRGQRVLRFAPPREAAMTAWRDRVLEWFDEGGYDVLVRPATARPPVAAGALAGRGYRTTLARSAWRVPFTQAWNLAGLPAVVAPVRIGGRPVGVQLVGRPGAESALLSAAARLEQRVVPMAGAAPRADLRLTGETLRVAHRASAPYREPQCPRRPASPPPPRAMTRSPSPSTGTARGW